MIKPNTFAEACYDQNSRAELEDALERNNSSADCKDWGITHQQWREQIQIALAQMDEDAEEETDEDETEHNATLIETGNGLPDVGGFAVEDGVLYQVEALSGSIETVRGGDTMRATVVEADWRDLEDGEEPQCSCELGDDQ